MPTDEERREVAARLRKHVGKPLFTGQDVEGIMGAQRSDFDLILADASYRRLANLIEPEERTCRMHDANWDDGQCTWGCICSECGAKHEHKRSVWMNFCPNCGAKVIQE